MKKIQVDSLSDLDRFFKEKTVEMTNAIRDSIQEAVQKKKKTAQLFEIEVDGVDNTFEITISSKEFSTALENCLRHYEEWEMGDDALDTYLLLKQVKS
jgi:hypothetical protein